jgi:hypothetical protein
MKTSLLACISIVMFFVACSRNREAKEEQIRVETEGQSTATDTATLNTIKGDVSLTQLATYPNKVILTGLPGQRLISIYKKHKSNSPDSHNSRSSSYYYDESQDEYAHFMPGIDLLFGYNLVNIAHYDFTTQKTKLLFDHPVLVKSLYYPSFDQDSLNKKPINRNYYLVSVYNEDTSGDTVISKLDLRRFFYINATAIQQLQLIPSDYSVVRSQYDSMNDIMYIFARHDENKNGQSERQEPLHVFWINLAKPETAKRLY